MRKAKLRHGALVACLTHKRRRSFKTKVSKPSNNCVICHLCWLSDRLETSLYEDDIEDLIKFSNGFPAVIKPSSTEFIEEAKDE